MSALLGRVEHITSNLTREWREPDLVVLVMTDVRRETVDAYIQTLLDQLAEWPREAVLYGLYDISAPGVSLTPYFRSRLIEIADYLKATGKRTCSAIVVPNTLMFRIFTLFGDMFTNRTGDDIITQKMFLNQQAALNWLAKLRQRPT